MPTLGLVGVAPTLQRRPTTSLLPRFSACLVATATVDIRTYCAGCSFSAIALMPLSLSVRFAASNSLAVA